MKSLGTSIVILWDTIKLKPVSTGVLSDSKDDQTGSQQSKIIWMDLTKAKSQDKTTWLRGDYKYTGGECPCQDRNVEPVCV